MEDQDDADQEQRLINEGSFSDLFKCLTIANSERSPQLTTFAEYKTWKKNSPFLYDMILR